MPSPADSAVDIQPLFSTTLDLPPCCLKFSSHCPGYFVIGTYYLENETEVPLEEEEAGNEQQSAETKPENPEIKQTQQESPNNMLEVTENEQQDAEIKPGNPEIKQTQQESPNNMLEVTENEQQDAEIKSGNLQINQKPDIDTKDFGMKSEVREIEQESPDVNQEDTKNGQQSAEIKPKILQTVQEPDDETNDSWMTLELHKIRQESPGIIRGESEVSSVDSETLRGDSETLRGDSETLRGDSETLRGDSETLRGDSEPIRGSQGCELTQIRHGNLELCRVVVTTKPDGKSELKVETVEKVTQPSAVYDLGFQGNLLAATTTTGSISLFEIMPPGKRSVKPAEENSSGPIKSESSIESCATDLGTAHLRPIKSYQLFKKPVIIIALKWCIVPGVFAVTTSDGGVLMLRLDRERGDDPNDVNLIPYELHTHTDYAYCVAWGGSVQRLAPFYEKLPIEDRRPVQVMNLFSGGDDFKLRCTQVAIGIRDPTITVSESAEFCFTKVGVTSILYMNTERDEVAHVDNLLVGSYDNKVYIVSIASETPLRRKSHIPMKPYKCVVGKNLDLGGTVHKLQIVGKQKDGPVNTLFVLATCAHVGVRMLRVTDDYPNFSINILGKLGHDLNYASDFRFAQYFQKQQNAEMQKFCEKGTTGIGISTSFYDRQLCAWKFDINENPKN